MFDFDRHILAGVDNFYTRSANDTNVQLTIYDQKVDRILAVFINVLVSTVVVIVFEKVYRYVAWSKLIIHYDSTHFFATIYYFVDLTKFECPRTLSNLEPRFTYKMIIFDSLIFMGH